MCIFVLIKMHILRFRELFHQKHKSNLSFCRGLAFTLGGRVADPTVVAGCGAGTVGELDYIQQIQACNNSWGTWLYSADSGLQQQLGNINQTYKNSWEPYSDLQQQLGTNIQACNNSWEILIQAFNNRRGTFFRPSTKVGEPFLDLQ